MPSDAQDTHGSGNSTYRVLSIDGGGYLGLATASFIHQIERHFGTQFATRFDLFCGTSTGAIIAAALAVGKSGAELVDLYRGLGPKVFAKKKARGLLTARYSLQGLRETLAPHLGDVRLGDVKQRGKSVLITAFNRTTGKPRIFKPDHSAQLSTDDGLGLLDVVLASSSAPTFFPSSTIVNPATSLTEVFCDGGLACNHPALLGFSEATYELGHAPADVRILSLSTPRKSLAEERGALDRCDLGKWQWKDSIIDILIDSNSDLVHETLRRITEVFGENGPVYRRIKLDNTDKLAIDDVTELATSALSDNGSRAAAIAANRVAVQEILEESAH